jgi:hypothetical protein
VGRVTETELMPSLDRGNTEQAGGKGKRGNRSSKPNFEHVPSRFAVGFDRPVGCITANYPDSGLPTDFNLDTGFIGLDFDFKFDCYLIGHLDVHLDPFL